MLKQVTTTALLAAAVFLTAQVAQAKTSPEGVQSTRVSYAGLNLANEGDARVLLQRIRRAAARVCSPTPDPLVMSSRAYRRCTREATSNAVANLHSPMVTALYQGKSPVEVARN